MAHHKENFVSKYIFSMDHKMISKQFLITGMFMGAVAMVLSAIFRAHLENPESGIITPDEYLALVTIHGTIMVFFVLTGWLSGTFDNLLITLSQPAPITITSIVEFILFAAFIVLNVEGFNSSLLCSAITNTLIKLPLLHF